MVYRGFYDNRTDNTLTIVSPDSGFTPSVGDEVYVEDLHATVIALGPGLKNIFVPPGKDDLKPPAPPPPP